jgi:hypothetical protein
LAAWIDRDIVGASDYPRSYAQAVPGSCGLHGVGSKDVWLYASRQDVVEPIHVQFREREGMRDRAGREGEGESEGGGDVTSGTPLGQKWY